MKCIRDGFTFLFLFLEKRFVSWNVFFFSEVITKLIEFCIFNKQNYVIFLIFPYHERGLFGQVVFTRYLFVSFRTKSNNTGNGIPNSIIIIINMEFGISFRFISDAYIRGWDSLTLYSNIFFIGIFYMNLIICLSLISYEYFFFSLRIFFVWCVLLNFFWSFETRWASS